MNNKSTCLVLGCLLMWGCNPHQKTTRNKEKEGQRTFLATHILTLERIDKDTIHVVSDGWLIRDAEGNPLDFHVNQGETFGRSPDYHAWGFYTVKDILDEGVLFLYESGFSHHSFGKDLTTIDKGRVYIPFTGEK